MGKDTFKVKILDFKTLKEDFNEYELEDGSRVKVKVVLADVKMAVDEEGRPKLNPDGNPIYHFNFETKVRILPKNRVVTMSKPSKPPEGIYG
ncbi:MAG: hypothetical protein ACXQTQ_01410 [Candidatus Hecatellaceae archaeon]